MIRAFTLVVIAVAFLGAVPSAHAGLIVNTVFDSTITHDANALAIENVINTAAQTYESLFANNATINIYFQEGGGLGSSTYFVYDETGGAGTFSYSQIYSKLLATNANPAAFAALTANGGGGINNPVTGTPTMEMKSATLRALGLNQPAGCYIVATGDSSQPNTCTGGFGAGAVDGIVTLNTSLTDPPLTSSGSAYGLLGVVEHEMDEVLGLGSALENVDCSGTGCGVGGVLNASNNTIYDAPMIEDLYRWDGNGNRTLTANCVNGSATSAYFSYGPSTGNIAQFNNLCNDGDFGDWASGPVAQTQDAFATPGTNPTVGPSEIAALTAIGYELAAPEPGTWLLVLGALALFGASKRRIA